MYRNIATNKINFVLPLSEMFVDFSKFWKEFLMCTAASNRGAYACGSDKICRVCDGEFVRAK